MPKLNAISMAAGAVIEKAAREQANREAAYLMPIKDAMRTLADNLRHDLDAALEVAIERQLCHPIGDVEALRGRLEVITVEGEEGETYHLDGVPILWRGPVALERDGDEMRASQTLKHLQSGTP